jgi:hypothetical protein
MKNESIIGGCSLLVVLCLATSVLATTTSTLPVPTGRELSSSLASIWYWYRYSTSRVPTGRESESVSQSRLFNMRESPYRYVYGPDIRPSFHPTHFLIFRFTSPHIASALFLCIFVRLGQETRSWPETRSPRYRPQDLTTLI